jgi:GTPase Era involved in 16S rRNA processing
VTVFDNDHINYCLGYRIKNGKALYSASVTPDDLAKWNSDDETEKIVLESNLDRIGSSKRIIVIHDTPGINYSGSSEHKKITIQHIENTKPGLVICLLDATQLETNDYKEALTSLKAALGNSPATKIIFVANKADAFDSEKESIADCLKNAADFLAGNGFDNPVLIPVSSRAARLLKMENKGLLADLSRKEKFDLQSYKEYFDDEKNNLSKFAIGAKLIEEKENTMGLLMRTGLPMVEREISWTI